MLKRFTTGFISFLVMSLIFVGAPRCIPTASLWTQLWAAASHDMPAMEDMEHCPHHPKAESTKKKASFLQDVITDGSGCQCKVNAFVIATPVNYEQPMVVHRVMPLPRDISPPAVEVLQTQVTTVPDSPPPRPIV